jgi:hypothetical protein
MAPVTVRIFPWSVVVSDELQACKTPARTSILTRYNRFIIEM